MDPQQARELDRLDPLRSFREAFVVADDTIYLDGNSLGRLPKRTVSLVRELVESEWGTDLVGGWGKGWLELPTRIGEKIATLIGAEPDEVIACDSTSVNLYKLAHAALKTQVGRTKVVTDEANFPSDLYLLQGLTDRLETVPADDPSAVQSALDGETALLALSHVAFKSGYLHDMQALTDSAHQVGALALWDLSHSVGAVPMRLRDWGVDLAVGCTYKYLNGGPGSVAFLYVRRDLQERLANPIQGWFGQRGFFQFDLDYTPAKGISRFLTGTPPILSLAAVEPGVDLLIEARMERLRNKSLAQTDLLIKLADSKLSPFGFQLCTPRETNRRGSHVSLRHPDAWKITQCLVREMKLVPDFRTPDVLRLGVAPIYTSFEEIVEAMNRIEQVMIDKRYASYQEERPSVT